MRPIVLLADPGLDLAAFQAALAPELDCRTALDGADPARVECLVTGDAPIGAAEAAPFPGLRLVVTCSVGVDHLKLDALAARGIGARNTPTYCTNEVADHALACVLAGWRGLGALHASVRAGEWDHRAAGVLRRVAGARLAIVGFGRIGRALGARAAALGVEVVAHDPVARPGDVPLLGLDEALAGADAVSLHAPGTPGRPPLLGARELALLAPGAVLVNLARPGLVDLDAMLAALRDGRLARAYWDVWPQEPPAAGDPRLATPGLVVTPHAAWYSAEAEAANTREAAEAIRDELLGPERAARSPHPR